MNDWFSTIAVSAVTIGLIYTYFTGSKKNDKKNDHEEKKEEKNEERKKIPGPPPSHPQLGNLLDIGAAGGYYHWLKKLHKEYGDVVSFMFGDKLTVSVYKPEHYKAMKHASDRPLEMFEIFSPLIAKECITYQNGSDGKRRRRAYDGSFSHRSMEGYYEGLTESTLELMDELAVADRSRLPVSQWTLRQAMKCCLRECFGDFFKSNDEIVRMKDNFDYCWKELESRAGGQYPEPGSERDRIFTERINDIQERARAMIEHRQKTVRENPNTPTKFIDIVMEFGGDDDSLVQSDLVDYILAAYMSTGDMMTWCFYLIGTHPEVEEKMYKEIMEVLGEDGQPTFENHRQLVYMKQVLDEVLRYSLLGTFTLRYAERELNLNGYVVPPDATTIQAIGITHMDPTYWPEPEKFDPDRFAPEVAATRPRHSFVPFGFCGGRQCPGFRFTYTETTIIFANLIRKYHIRFSTPQKDPERMYGLLTFLKDEIYVDLEERHPVAQPQKEAHPVTREVRPQRHLVEACPVTQERRPMQRDSASA